MIEELERLQEKMRKGIRIGREDLPEELKTLEECLNLHSAEYAVNYELMDHKLKKTTESLHANQDRNTELVALYREACRFIVSGVDAGCITLPSNTPGDPANAVYHRCKMHLSEAVPDFVLDNKLRGVREYLAWVAKNPQDASVEAFSDYLKKPHKALYLLNKKELDKTIFEWTQQGATATYLKAKVENAYINVAVQNSITKETIALQWSYGAPDENL